MQFEIQDRLFEKFGINVSISMIGRALKDMDITHKKVSAIMIMIMIMIIITYVIFRYRKLLLNVMKPSVPTIWLISALTSLATSSSLWTRQE